ncbi:MAG: IS1634 family transposase [Actinomycetota bacterium]
MDDRVREFLSGVSASQAGHLPVVAGFLSRIGLAGAVNAAVPSQMEVDIGTYVSLMVLDTLSGRSPLYRLEKFASSVDTGLLLGGDVPASAFNDTAVARAMDAIFCAGTEKVFSEVALRAASAFPLEVDRKHVHFDTTSVSVWGDYPGCEEIDDPESLRVTYGHSKDRRPDLKQFLIKMLCVHRNIPIIGGCESGNSPDKKINNRVLTELSRHMASHGLSPGAFVYISDSAFVTPANLEAIAGNLFITRLPFTYAEADRAITEAVREGEWAEVPGEPRGSGSRPKTNYRVCDAMVSLYDKEYRAVVVHSDAGDKRAQKKIIKALTQSIEEAGGILEEAGKTEYFCREDASAAADRLRGEGSALHYPDCGVREKVTYSRGRPPKNGERKVSRTRYVLEGKLAERADEVERMRQAAGCFMLLTNVPGEGEMAHTPEEILAAYKEQHGIERNFGFLKDPLIVNDIFLKRPDRIEVLGFILLVSLLVWNLMEHVMRAYLRRTESTIPGWDNKPTRKPTSFMMAIKFKGTLVFKIRGVWYFSTPLTDELQQYIRALGLTEDLLLRRIPDNAAAQRDQKLPGGMR